jgi:hypothetical protein
VINIRYSLIRDYPNYIIYDNGSIWSDSRNKFLNPWIGTKGYYFVTLCNNGECKNFRIHRLVALHFVPNTNNLTDVNHKDENKGNNNANNLEWINKIENNNYGTRNERSGKSRIDNPKCCTGVNQYTLNNILITQYPSIKEAHRLTGINNIVRCCQGERHSAGGYMWRYANEICKNS